jgi:hypothetical protein
MTDDEYLNSLDWLRSEEGEDWLRHAPHERLVGRQAFLLFHDHNRPHDDAMAQHDLIERAIVAGSKWDGR